MNPNTGIERKRVSHPTDRPWCRPSGVNDLSPLSTSQREALGKNAIGVAPKTAWMSYNRLTDQEFHENSFGMEEIQSNYGFEDTPSDRLLASRTTVHVSSVRTSEDCTSATDGIVFGVRTDFSGGDRPSLIEALRESVNDPNTIGLAARSSSGDKGAFSYSRELTLYPDFISLDFRILGMEASNDLVRAALLSAFFVQTVVDIETAVMSLSRAGHAHNLTSSISVFNDSEKLFTLLAERVSLAFQDSFDEVGGPVPADVDAEPFYDDNDSVVWVR